MAKGSGTAGSRGAAAAPSEKAASAAPVVPVSSVGTAAPLPRLNDIGETEAVAELLMGKAPDKELRAAGAGSAQGQEDGGQQTEQEEGHEHEPGDELPPGGAGDEGEEEDGADEKPEQLKGKEGADAHEFYAREVKMQDGSTVTVGELKDAWQQRAQRELDIQERETKLATDHVELERIVKYFDAIPFPVKYRAAHELDEIVRREAAGIMEIFPTWRDEKVRQADEADILAMAREYGREAFIAAELRMPTDRMVVKMLADYARLRRSVSTARERLRQVTPTEKPAARRAAPANGKDAQQALAARAKQTGRDADETAAVAALFRR